MKFKPHIKLVDGLWCCYPRRNAPRPVMIMHLRSRLYVAMKRRHELSIRSAQDRAAGRALRQSSMAHMFGDKR